MTHITHPENFFYKEYVLQKWKGINSNDFGPSPD